MCRNGNKYQRCILISSKKKYEQHECHKRCISLSDFTKYRVLRSILPMGKMASPFSHNPIAIKRTESVSPTPE